MEENKFAAYLKELAAKYSVAGGLEVSTDGEKVSIACDKGNYHFYFDFSKIPDAPENAVPLFHWRNKRKYIELKNILKTKMIEDPRGIRVHHIVPKDQFNRSLLNIIVNEVDLAEFITGQKVDRIFADFSSEAYTNCIVSTSGNLKISMELGFSPKGSEPVLLHEIIARTGIASDVVVDTQMQQYPIYVIRGKDIAHYNEIDNELYGLDNTQADCIRFILSVLSDTEVMPDLQKDWRHLLSVYAAAKKATQVLEYTEVAY